VPQHRSRRPGHREHGRLAEVMSKRNRNVLVLPNSVPQSRFDAPHAAGPKGLTIG
jgi:hypothetical protein